MTHNECTSYLGPMVERLEDRIAPATLPLLDLSDGPVIGTFTDADGDKVTVRIDGVAGKVEFRDAGGSEVNDGEDIASVIITGSSADFVLTYSFDASGNGANNVAMGDITANKILRGIFSVPLNNSTGTFTLGSFVGPGFSAGGGLSTDDVAGNTDGLGIQLDSLGAGRAVNVRNNFIGDLVILGSLGGSITVGAEVQAGSAWQVNKNVAPTAQIAIGTNFEGTFESRGAFAGDVTIGENAFGTWTFTKDVLASARIQANGWTNIQALKNWGGQLLAFSEPVSLAVGGQILGTSVIASEDQIAFTISGSVQSGAVIGCSNNVIATVGGNVGGHWTNSGELELTVGGNISHAVLTSGSDISLTVNKGISESKIFSGSDLNLDVDRSIVASELIGHNSIFGSASGSIVKSKMSTNSDISLSVGGDVSGSHIAGNSEVGITIAGRLVGSQIVCGAGDSTDSAMLVRIDGDVLGSTISGLETVASLTVGRNLIGSIVQAEDIPAMLVAGSILNSDISSSDNINAEVTGNIKGSTIAAAFSDIALSIGGSFISSSVACDEQIDISIEGKMSGLVMSYSSDVTMTVGGTLSGKAVAGELIIADIGELTGSLTARELDLTVQGNVAPSARIDAQEIDDFNADTIGFHIGGSFGGLLNVGHFDSDVVGGSTLVEGDVLKSARLNIVASFGDSADESYMFGGDFLGVLNIGGDIDVNLAFAGDVNQVIIGGLVGTSGAVNAITVAGKLKFLSSGSLFDETTERKEGSFVNGAGTASATLSIEGGFQTVTPVA